MVLRGQKQNYSTLSRTTSSSLSLPPSGRLPLSASLDAPPAASLIWTHACFCFYSFFYHYYHLFIYLFPSEVTLIIFPFRTQPPPLPLSPFFTPQLLQAPVLLACCAFRMSRTSTEEQTPRHACHRSSDGCKYIQPALRVEPQLEEAAGRPGFHR